MACTHLYIYASQCAYIVHTCIYMYMYQLCYPCVIKSCANGMVYTLYMYMCKYMYMYMYMDQCCIVCTRVDEDCVDCQLNIVSTNVYKLVFTMSIHVDTHIQ